MDRETVGVAVRLFAADPLTEFAFDFRTPCSFSSLALFDKLSIFPLPNLLQGCPGFVRCLFSWNMRHMSDW